MKKKDKEQKLSIAMREDGCSLNKIAKTLDVSKGSVSVWVAHLPLNQKQKEQLKVINKNKESYLRSPKKCADCNKDLPYVKRTNKFCDSSCSAKYSAKHRVIKPINNCLNCGKDTKRKFCCSDCSIEYNYKQREQEAIETGLAPSNQGSAKRLILHMRGHFCEICGITEWVGKEVPLVLDHINGKCKDWRLDNLRLVCGNCDMQLPTYKSKNKDSQRKSRNGSW